MKIVADEENKIVEIWLTNAEQCDETLMNDLHTRYKQYREKKYRVAVFCSGERELPGLTGELLLHNRAVFARKDLEQEQGMGMSMGL